MQTWFLLIAIIGVFTASIATPTMTDYVTEDENARLAWRYLELQPIAVPSHFYQSPESELEKSLSNGVAEIEQLNAGNKTILSENMESRINEKVAQYADQAKGLASKFGVEQVVSDTIDQVGASMTDRRTLIFVDPMANDGDMISVRFGTREVDVTLNRTPKALNFDLPDRHFVITAVHDGDGQGVTAAVMRKTARGFLEPVIFPVLKKGEAVRVEIM
jgi:hypothetical protein